MSSGGSDNLDDGQYDVDFHAVLVQSRGLIKLYADIQLSGHRSREHCSALEGSIYVCRGVHIPGNSSKDDICRHLREHGLAVEPAVDSPQAIKYNKRVLTNSDLVVSSHLLLEAFEAASVTCFWYTGFGSKTPLNHFEEVLHSLPLVAGAENHFDISCTHHRRELYLFAAEDDENAAGVIVPHPNLSYIGSGIYGGLEFVPRYRTQIERDERVIERAILYSPLKHSLFSFTQRQWRTMPGSINQLRRNLESLRELKSKLIESFDAEGMRGGYRIEIRVRGLTLAAIRGDWEPYLKLENLQILIESEIQVLKVTKDEYLKQIDEMLQEFEERRIVSGRNQSSVDPEKLTMYCELLSAFGFSIGWVEKRLGRYHLWNCIPRRPHVPFRQAHDDDDDDDESESDGGDREQQARQRVRELERIKVHVHRYYGQRSGGNRGTFSLRLKSGVVWRRFEDHDDAADAVLQEFGLDWGAALRLNSIPRDRRLR